MRNDNNDDNISNKNFNNDYVYFIHIKFKKFLY